MVHKGYSRFEVWEVRRVGMRFRRLIGGIQDSKSGRCEKLERGSDQMQRGQRRGRTAGVGREVGGRGPQGQVRGLMVFQEVNESDHSQDFMNM